MLFLWSMTRHVRFALVFLAASILSTGCTAAGYANNRVDAPANAVQIHTNAIEAQSDMSHACGGSSYTVDNTSLPTIRVDRDERDVTFHCDDGSVPNVRE